MNTLYDILCWYATAARLLTQFPTCCSRINQYLCDYVSDHVVRLCVRSVAGKLRNNIRKICPRSLPGAESPQAESLRTSEDSGVDRKATGHRIVNVACGEDGE